jgi:carboxymethylenebutenolidase
MPETRQDTIPVATPSGTMSVVVRAPAGGGPLVVLFHDGPGIRPDIHEIADRLVAAGYLVAVPDLYYRVGELLSFDPRRGQAESARMMSAIETVTAGDVEGDTACALRALAEAGRWDGDRAACVGFCLGASVVLRVMGEDGTAFRVGAGFHPSFCVTDEPDSPHRAVPRIRGSLHMAFGAADEVASLQLNEPLLRNLAQAGTRSTVTIHPGAGHGFMMPYGRHFDAAASERSWAQTLPAIASGLAA